MNYKMILNEMIAKLSAAGLNIVDSFIEHDSVDETYCVLNFTCMEHEVHFDDMKTFYVSAINSTVEAINVRFSDIEIDAKYVTFDVSFDFDASDYR